MSKISVIIPTLNEELYLPLLLHDLAEQKKQPHEIIIVDGKSTDTTIQHCKKRKNVVVLTSIKNPAIQRNTGGDKAKGDLLVFLDADVRLDNDFLEKIGKEYNKKKFSITCPFYLPYKSNWIIFSMYLFFNSLFFLFQKITPSGAGSCIIMTKKIFSEEKGFRSMYQFDDIELIRRIGRKKGFHMMWDIVWVSDRRFKKYGSIKIFLQYLLLSILFFLGLFKAANYITYEFGKFKK